MSKAGQPASPHWTNADTYSMEEFVNANWRWQDCRRFFPERTPRGVRAKYYDIYLMHRDPTRMSAREYRVWLKRMIKAEKADEPDISPNERQDKTFQAAMKKAIEKGLERLPLASEYFDEGRLVRFYPPRPIFSEVGSPAAMCAALGSPVQAF